MMLETELAPSRRFAGRVGLLAGGGRFPFYFVEAARRHGVEVVCVAIKDHADRALANVVDRLHWVRIAQLGKMIRSFRRESVDCVVMAGKIHKKVMFTPFRIFHYWPDWRGAWFWISKQRGDNRDDSLLLGIINEFQKDGIRFASALEVCPELLVKEGVLTRRSLTSRERTDVEFGWTLAKEMGRLDVGQSVAVKESAVLAVEAIEGTDEAVKRAGSLCPSGGFVVVKVAKPKQDMRFDVPTIGVNTVKNVHESGGRVIAVEADKTILMDAGPAIKLADQLGISIIAVSAEQMPGIEKAA